MAWLATLDRHPRTLTRNVTVSLNAAPPPAETAPVSAGRVAIVVVDVVGDGDEPP